jgi:trimeric autotransporter adhesin
LTVTAPSLQSITVSPATASVAKGATLQFAATGHFSDASTQNLTATVTWSSSNTTIATVSNTSGTQGLATGIAAGGPVTITAAQGTIKGTAQLTVTALAVVSINVTPANVQLPVGASQQYVATAAYSDGSTKNITKTATWSSSSTPIATIGKSGLAKTIGLGTTTIRASNGKLTGVTTLTTFHLTISPLSATIALGGTQQFTATANFANGSTSDLTDSVTWKSSNTKVATITAAGLSTGQKAGITNITATDAGVTATAAKLTVQ